ncbi:MAG TPA: histidine kinase dimerization/phospho-acceptor domain-containing protein, partial [Pseudomonadales bacterium]|nr:histidine kinase dimerization/phospho-acceptor domain-containing protein [Pseudomonadales bacterium]
MLIAPIPDNEEKRLQALARYHILDTEKEAAYEDIVALASYICETPIALVSLIDRDRQWFKASFGLEEKETPRDVAFCSHAILESAVFIVPDATQDERFADNPLVIGAPDIRFYAGAPLITHDGFRLGTLCVIDTVPKQLAPAQEKALAALSRQVITQLELRIAVEKLTLALDELTQKEEALRAEKLNAEQLASARARFLSNMSHDIRTPLNAIIGFGKILSKLSVRNDWDADSKEFLNRINDGSRYLLNLINHILDLAKLESGQEVALKQPVEIRPFCEQVGRLLQS